MKRCFSSQYKKLQILIFTKIVTSKVDFGENKNKFNQKKRYQQKHFKSNGLNQGGIADGIGAILFFESAAVSYVTVTPTET